MRRYLYIYLSKASAQWTARLLSLAQKFTPLAALDEFCPLQACVLDISGTERVHVSETLLAHKILKALARLDAQSKIAIAPSVGAAHALAKYGALNPCIVDQAELEERLPFLPAAALRLQPQVLLALQQVGIHYINDLLKLPRNSLAIRFGAQLVTRLEQVFAERAETLKFFHVPLSFVARKNFEIPLTKKDAVSRACLKLLENLFAQLKAQKKKAGLFQIELSGAKLGGQEYKITKELSLHLAAQDFSQLRSTISHIIDQLQPAGAVRALCIWALTLQKAESENMPLHVGAAAAAPELNSCAEQLLNNLVLRLGKDAVCALTLHQSYIPEKSFGYYPLTKVATHKAAPLCLERPPLLLPEPEPFNAIALLPDSPPAWIKWKGRRLKVLKARGPEKICAEWWQQEVLGQELGERHYFKIQSESGLWLWVFRDQTMRWYVHGMWI